MNSVVENSVLGDRSSGHDTSGVSVSGWRSFPREANRGDSTLLSVVVPLYNEDDVLREFHRRLVGVLDKMSCLSEVIYINDGSTDASLDVLNELQTRDDRIAVISLSRNFGKEIAVTAGLDYAHGDAAVIIDADLQDPPELILSLVERWKEGNDVVYAIRRERRGETWIKRATADMFYRVMENIAETPIPRNAGDFRLMDKRCIAALSTCRERRRFMKGLFAWVGFKQVAVTYDRDPRFAGTTKWNYWRLWNFAIEGITSFTIAPLKLATYFGLLTALASLAYGTFIICRTALLGRDVPGYASIMAVILFLAGAQLIAIGVIGEYVGRIFVESKSRPLYLVDTCIPSRKIGKPVEISNQMRG